MFDNTFKSDSEYFNIMKKNPISSQFNTWSISGKQPKYILNQYNLAKRFILNNSIDLRDSQFLNQTFKLNLRSSSSDSLIPDTLLLKKKYLAQSRKQMRLNVAILLQIIFECRHKQYFRFHLNLNIKNHLKSTKRSNWPQSRVAYKPTSNQFSELLKHWEETTKSIERSYIYDSTQFKNLMDNWSMNSNVMAMVRFLKSKII